MRAAPSNLLSAETAVIHAPDCSPRFVTADETLDLSWVVDQWKPVLREFFQ